MSDPVYLQMPKGDHKAAKLARPSQGGFFRRLAQILVLAALCTVGIAVYWQMQGGITSLSAVVDGTVYPVTPEFSAVLESLSVRPGDRVTAGQEVGRMAQGSYTRALRDAERDVAGMRPPSMEESAGRLRQAQEAEKEIVMRLANARNDEDARRTLMEERVTEYVHMQLQLRGFDSQGGEKVVGKARYAEARIAEAKAKGRMDGAKAEFEQVSRMRAALDQELGRIRNEMLRAKQLASQNRYRKYSGAGTAPQMLQADGRLFAPVDGQILRVDAQRGQMVAKGASVLWVQPEGAAAAVWVLAYLPLEAAHVVKAGQVAHVRILPDGASLTGKVEHIYAPQALPEALAGGRAEVRQRIGAASQVLPARVALAANANVVPGSPASCTVETRSILGFSGFGGFNGFSSL